MKRPQSVFHIALIALLGGCASAPVATCSDAYAATKVAVMSSDGRAGIYQLTIQGGVAKEVSPNLIEIRPRDEAHGLRVVLLGSGLAELVQSASGVEGETWAFATTGIVIQPSLKLGDGLELKFENATLFPGLAVAEKNIGPLTLNLPNCGGEGRRAAQFVVRDR